jgi:hypothetical protein
MKKAITKTHGGKRPGAGRPAVGKDPLVNQRMPLEMLAAIRDWAASEPGQPSRSEAIRRLVEIGLKAKK